MGKILNGILGGVTGKVGGVVGANWKGIDYIRSYTIPANPNTAAQQTQRGKLTFAVAAARLLLGSIIQPFWDPFVSAMSGFNRFMQVNLPLLSATPDYSELKISEGSLEGTEITSATYAASAVSIDFNDTASGNGAEDDLVFAVVIDEANDVAFFNIGTVERADASISVTVGTGRTASNLHAYVFTKRGSGESLMVSDSDYSAVS